MPVEAIKRVNNKPKIWGMRCPWWSSEKLQHITGDLEGHVHVQGYVPAKE